jgi:hypothetical protein
MYIPTRVQNGCTTQQNSHLFSTLALFNDIKRPTPQTNHLLPLNEPVELYLHSTLCLHRVVLNNAQGQLYIYLINIRYNECTEIRAGDHIIIRRDAKMRH